ncbi:MAG: hypothetical protein DME04_22735 [Candidatus Rokuibacteriota bacterium]|nr:MAG: hypothetical protein DME04_22735 [Candidatus Rokubacteria bacterium]
MERTTARRGRRPAAVKTSAPADPGLGTAAEAPERAFAARRPRPAPEPPPPANRHAIFFDVENTSNPGRISRVLERLAIDRRDRRTEFFAIGNWRVIGAETARLLARHGAQLVHSAPSTGVRDWSDLRIAVSAGVWLAVARPGDVLEVVSDDRAFDAVGDVAAALGIAFHRLTSRAIGEASEPAPTHGGSGGDRRRRRGGRGRRGRSAPVTDIAPWRPEPPRPESSPAPDPGEAHTAPHDELVLVVRELADRSPNGAVLIDNVARTLKARGFSRPPGSPRLVTRLRRIKELSVSPTGMISLAQPAAPVDVAPVPPIPIDETSVAAPAPAGRRRRSRRGGRRRRRPRAASSAEGR